MWLHGLAPGMENAQQADLGPEMLGIGSDCSRQSPVGYYFQWNIDSNSNNGPRLS